MHAVQVFNTHSRYRPRHAATIALVRKVLRGEKISSAALNIVFVPDKTMRGLNGTFLGHWHVTDVLSFPLSEQRQQLEGEVYVNLDQAARQARTYGVTAAEERSRLIIHGVLHLAGYDDARPAQRKRMRRREDHYLNIEQKK
ncbi:MAG TPA: rRNA maturation RNase YbeY [Bacteroidota bacterium]|nr:rRNA maturation RNase YbeY [Bacteroidota bacterium]